MLIYYLCRINRRRQRSLTPIEFGTIDVTLQAA